MPSDPGVTLEGSMISLAIERFLSNFLMPTPLTNGDVVTESKFESAILDLPLYHSETQSEPPLAILIIPPRLNILLNSSIRDFISAPLFLSLLQA